MTRPYRTLADLAAATDEFLLGDATAKNHLAPHILASLAALSAEEGSVLTSEQGHGKIVNLGDGRLVALRPDDMDHAKVRRH